MISSHDPTPPSFDQDAGSITGTSFTPPTPDNTPSLYDVSDLYDAIVQPGPCEAFYREEARRCGGPVLELACGTGRLTVPIARDVHDVVGLDASRAMLDAATRKAEAAGVPITFVRGDMRDFDLGRHFALVVISCNSLSHMLESEDVRLCLRTVRRHLAPGGLLAFDVVLPHLHDLVLPEGVPRRLDLGPNPSSAIEAEEMVQYDPVQQLRISHWRVRQPDGQEQTLAPLVQRQFFPQELSLLLEAEGLELAARYGDFARNPLEAWSLNQICMARVPASD